ncbi:hypothetical protein [Peterkaempfera griseoplana]|uniref:hypothetical protein n=1 Tax=Peterkaempfera griseoplana TaxID=66896 RepID=UPI0006E2251C|nr:hypothetical protein [Peterkaempfera griseoplana]
MRRVLVRMTAAAFAASFLAAPAALAAEPSAPVPTVGRHLLQAHATAPGAAHRKQTTGPTFNTSAECQAYGVRWADPNMTWWCERNANGTYTYMYLF